MSIKISDMTPGADPDGTELIEATQNGATVHLTVRQMSDAAIELTYAKRLALGEVKLGEN